MRRVLDTETAAGRRFWRLAVVGLLLAILVTAAWQRWLYRQTQRAVMEEAMRVEAELTGRVDAYIALLRGAAGLFAASDDVTREDFKLYVAQLDFARNYPGAQEIGFSLRIPAPEVDPVGWTRGTGD
jgi:CHASE1-domain containing sensor protein